MTTQQTYLEELETARSGGLEVLATFLNKTLTTIAKQSNGDQEAFSMLVYMISQPETGEAIAACSNIFNQRAKQ